MAYSLSPWLKPRFFITGTNRPLAGGLMYTYKAGTTDNATTYSDDAGTPNTNPIVLNSDGECDLYLDDSVSYRIILKNAAGVTQFDKDRVASLGSTQVQSFNSIAALQLRSGTTIANAAKTLGYYAAGDGGGNSFYWDGTSTATDNGGTVIKPTSVSGAGRWLAVNPNVCNLKQFGAKYGGSANDTTYVTAAIAACKRVYVTGNHTYLFDNVPIFDDSEIVFNGGAKVGLRTGGSGFAFVSTGTSETHKNRILIKRGRIDGSNTLLGLLSATYTDDIKLIRCRADNLGATNLFQGQLAGFTNCSDVLVDNGYCKTACYGVSFTTCTNAVVQGGTYKSLAKDGVLFYNNTTSCKAIGVHVDGYNTLNENGRAGIHFYGGYDGVANGCTVLNSTGTTSDTGGIRFRDFYNFSVSGGIIKNASVGVLTNHIGDFTATKEYGSISGLVIDTTVYEGIYITAGRVVINGNTIRNTTKDGILLGTSASNSTISNNSIHNTVNTTARAIICAANYCTIQGNVCGIDTALGGSNVPQIGYSGLFGTIDGNSFTTTGTANLAIRIYSGGSARIGLNNSYGLGMTTELVNNGTEIGLLTPTVGVTNTVIAHGLGYIPNNISITPFADARVWISAGADATNINLTASASVLCQVRVW